MKTKLLRKARRAVRLYRNHKGDLFLSIGGVPRYCVMDPHSAQALYRSAVREAARQIYTAYLRSPAGILSGADRRAPKTYLRINHKTLLR